MYQEWRSFDALHSMGHRRKEKALYIHCSCMIRTACIILATTGREDENWAQWPILYRPNGLRILTGNLTLLCDYGFLKCSPLPSVGIRPTVNYNCTVVRVHFLTSEEGEVYVNRL